MSNKLFLTSVRVSLLVQTSLECEGSGGLVFSVWALALPSTERGPGSVVGFHPGGSLRHWLNLSLGWSHSCFGQSRREPALGVGSRVWRITVEPRAVAQERVWIWCVGCWRQTQRLSASCLQMASVLSQGFGWFCSESGLLCLCPGLWGCAGLVCERWCGRLEMIWCLAPPVNCILCL